MKRLLKVLALLFLLLILSYVLGPKSKYAPVNNEPIVLDLDITEVDAYVKQTEAQVPNIKANNQAQIIWADSLAKTEYAFIYLHGFSASHGEGYPIIQNMAKRYGYNTYLSRLDQHGLSDNEAFLKMTPVSMLESAKKAIAIAKTIGHKVIVFSCSTGSTYSAYLAAQDEAIVAQLMLSPNFDMADPNSQLLVKPWGKQIFKQMMGGDYRVWQASDEAKKFWNTTNRIEGYIALRDLVNQTMTPDIFAKNKVPAFIGYYYKDEEHKDKIISIDAIKNYVAQAPIPKDKLKVIPFSDAQGHVICSSYMNTNWESVQDAMFLYLDKTLKLPVSGNLRVITDMPSRVN